MSDKTKTILLVGGGSGGHIIPILNLQKELVKNKSFDVHIVGGNSPMDLRLYENASNFHMLITGKMHRAFTWNNFFEFLKLFIGVFQSLLLLLKIKPSLVFSKAGYVSLPIIIWARFLKIPYFIHESDIEMGQANLFAAKDARLIFTGFPEKYYNKRYANKLVYSGQILRPEIFKSKLNNFDFGFQSQKPVIFVTGGSQGSRNINNAIFASLLDLIPKYNLIHHTGIIDYRKAIDIRAGLPDIHKKSYFVTDLLVDDSEKGDRFLSAVMESSIVVSRASATTIAEVAVMKRPIIMIPYKYAASDHQMRNALFYEKESAGVVISDDELSAKNLQKQIDHLFQNKESLDRMVLRAYHLTKSNGLQEIVAAIINFKAKD